MGRDRSGQNSSGKNDGEESQCVQERSRRYHPYQMARVSACVTGFTLHVLAGHTDMNTAKRYSIRATMTILEATRPAINPLAAT
jgi:hypothetical protein